MNPNNPFKNKVAYKVFIYEQDMVLNNPQGLICHKTLTNLNFEFIPKIPDGKYLNYGI